MCAAVTDLATCTGNNLDGTARLVVTADGTLDNTCTQCVVGTSFGPADGSSNCVAVTPCGIQLDGYTRKVGSYSATADITSCDACSAGSWAATNGDMCVPHTVRDACTGNTLDGTPRLVAGTPTADSSCTSCISGTSFGPADGSSDCVAVTPCGIQVDGTTRKVGSYSATADITSCGACSAGSWAATNGDNCVVHTPRDACTGNTLGGTSRLVAGTATADSSCTSCISGTSFGPADGNTDCIAVTTPSCGDTDSSSGTARASIDATATTDNTCAACAANTWAATGADDCVAVTTLSCGMTTVGGSTARATISATATTDNSCAECAANTWAATFTDDCIAECIAKDATKWAAVGCVTATPTGNTVVGLGDVTPATGYTSCVITCDTAGAEFTVVAKEKEVVASTPSSAADEFIFNDAKLSIGTTASNVCRIVPMLLLIFLQLF